MVYWNNLSQYVCSVSFVVDCMKYAVAIRIRNMQDEGIIEAFTVNLNPEKLGRPIYDSSA